MAFTILVVATEAESTQSAAFFVSQEYLPCKDLDEQGKPLRDRPWQHPEISSLYFSDLGTLSGKRRPAELIDYLLEMGSDYTGGHFRVVKVASKPAWLEGRIVSWSYQDTLDRQFESECEKRRQLDEVREAARRARVYGFCDLCRTQTEHCKNPSHRGIRRCMRCSGGVGNSADRFCTNCTDLPWREQRERAAGHTITYLNEEQVAPAIEDVDF